MKLDPDHSPLPASATSPADPAAGAGDVPAQDDWDTGPPRRNLHGATVTPGPALTDLGPAEKIDAYIRRIDQLVDKTHPLAIEYLSIAQTVAADNPGRERLVNNGCKLAKAVQQMITAASRLSGR